MIKRYFKNLRVTTHMYFYNYGLKDIERLTLADFLMLYTANAQYEITWYKIFGSTFPAKKFSRFEYLLKTCENKVIFLGFSKRDVVMDACLHTRKMTLRDCKHFHKAVNKFSTVLK